MTPLEIASIAAVIIAGTSLVISLLSRRKQGVAEHAARMTRIEEDVKELQEKHSAMISDVDKLTDNLTKISTRQAVMEVKLDTLQTRIDTVYETVSETNVSLQEFMIATSSSLTKVQTEIQMLHPVSNEQIRKEVDKPAKQD